MSEPKALIVDDEPQMLMILEYLLTNRGFTVHKALNGAEAMAAFQSEAFDIVVLDVTMPRIGGVAVCQRMRATSDVPIIMVTARSQTEQILAGFDAGADDYVIKPFEPRILLSRIDSVLRRGRGREQRRSEFGMLTIDWSSHTVRVSGKQITLPETEWRLLAALAEHPGEVRAWRLLLTQGWQSEDWVGGRDLVKATIYRLRQRLGPDAADLIVTVRGSGYLLDAGA